MNAMVHCLSRSLAFLCLFFFQVTAWGQLSANFTATPQSGCSPLVVTFADQSSGNPTQWKWDLGNGVISTLKNPSATYFNPGTYPVKLVVRNTAGSDSVIKTSFITVYAAPSVSFSASDTTGCFPLPVQFTDNSVAGSGTITSWQWDFGDGNISNQQNPKHVYSASGLFAVTLKVINSMGCVKVYSRNQYIKITSGVKAAFTNNTPGPCRAPVDVQFSNASAGPGNLSYVWNFGDGVSSTATDPVHTYTKDGTYTVSLIAISAQGCRDTIIKSNLLHLGTIQSAIAVRDTACKGETFSFTNTSTPQPASQLWLFGDGTTSTEANPLKTYAATGKYTIKLINNFGGCTDSVSKEITVTDKPKALFTAASTTYCTVPATVTFTSSAIGATSLVWNFGDGTTATGNSPTHTYQAKGIYTVTLFATNASGCTDTLVKKDYIQVQKPQTTLSGLPRTGCVPLTINPSATVVTNQTVSRWLWNFGDGTTSTTQNPVHTYTTTGNFTVSLIITTTGGCTDTVVYTDAVRAGTKPVASLAVTPTDVCAYQAVSFTDKSSGKVDQWLWSFGDGSVSTDQHPVHEYSDTGWFDVQLVVWNNTCADTFLLKKAVHIRPPIAAFNATMECADKYTRTFSDASIGATSWFWNFGDGTTSAERNPIHTYSATGNYSVTLTVSNGTCTHHTTQVILIINETANFNSADSVVCRNAPASFTANGINASNIGSWNWNFGDGTWSNTTNSATHHYTKSGTYTVTLTITDLYKCVSIKTTEVKVYGPVAAFTTSAPAACLYDNAIRFMDGSTTDGSHSIISRVWSFGDGQTDTTNQSSFVHAYKSTGVFNLSLTVSDAYGCTDQLSKPAELVIAQPEANFSSTDTLSCTGGIISFQNSSKALNAQYHWQFGDGGESAALHPVHSYNAVGIYDIKLLVTDQYGCKDSLARPAYITISQPRASFTVSDSIGTCPPMQVNFVNTSINYTSYHWDFGDGTTSTLMNPSHFYTTAGTFYPMLVLQGPGGCTDTVRHRIMVKGPSGSFSYTPLSGCKPLEVAFTATTANAATFIWDFSDGNTLPTSNATVSHTYITSGEFVPKMILIDADGCNVSITGNDTIRVTGITPGFTTNGNRFCDAASIQFTNTTISNDYITGYSWNFGDGTESTEVNPVHFYTTPGTYMVSLNATTASGCRDSVAYVDTIFILPRPAIRTIGGGAQCAPASFTFNGTLETGSGTVASWQWNFANGQTSALQNPAEQTYTVAGDYTVITVAKGINGCTDTATSQVTIYPVPDTRAGPDVAICRGAVTTLTATGADKYVWNTSASLSCNDCASTLAAPTDSVQYTVTGTSAFGCSSKDSVIVTVHQPFTMAALPGDTLCLGGTARLNATGADLYTWTPSVYVTDASKGITTAKPIATTAYQVIGKDKFNCFADTAEVFVKVYPIPTVNAGADQTLVVGNTINLNPSYSADVVYYKWLGNGTLDCNTCRVPVAQPRQTTTYTLEVKNEGGCTATDQMTVFVVCGKGNLYIPNTFSPNGDGANDRFYPSGSGINMIKSLKVFNRWGEVVFERSGFSANDAASGWDGTFKGQPLSADVYVYTCDVVCQNGEVLLYKGDLTLLK